MTNIPESPYPYPPRQSEFVKELQIGFPEISLNDEQKAKLRNWEEPFCKRIGESRDISLSDHVIFPGAFVSEEGKKLFAATYLDPNLEDKIKAIAQKLGLDWGKTKDQKKASDQFFDDLLADIDNLSVTPRLGDVKEEDIVRIFNEADLVAIPKRIRERLNTWSSKGAEERFKEEFIKAQGELDLVANPRKVTRIVNPEDLKKKEEGLREIKRDLKKTRSESEAEDDKDLGKAKQEVCDLYLRYVNVLLAGLSPIKRVDGSLSPRSIERYDHFLNGVGLAFGSNGLLETIPEALSNYAQKRLSQMSEIEETEEYQKDNSVKVNASQAKKLAEIVLKAYGFDKEGWEAVVLERQGGLSVDFDKSLNIREVRIPKDLNAGLVRILALLAHEIEGHGLRYANKEKALKEGLLITQELGTGRSSVLSEGAAMWMEDATQKEVAGMARPALPYYWIGLEAKSEGGTFKECFYAILKARAKANKMTIKDLLLDREKFDHEFDNAYSNTLRLFRRFTPFDEGSGYIPISETLDYLEQELVVEFLMNQKSDSLSKLLFVGGIDLYSINSLIKLGLLDLSQVRKPQMVVAKVLWPQIKLGLDQGKDIDQIITSIQL